MIEGQSAHSLAEILACPICLGGVSLQGDKVICQKCAHSFPIRRKVPIFLLEEAVVAPEQHVSNSIGTQFEEILLAGKEFVLNLGAGATSTRYPNCVELEHKVFRHTDVVGDAHRLPFRDNAFDRVFAFNLFEHLSAPKTAAAEILRVLKPGGTASIHTAFLQALHEAPAHYYNATEFGVREWFASFEIEACAVSGNFGPGMMLGFLMASLLDTARAAGASEEDQTALKESTLGEWADFWARKNAPPAGFDMLQTLPQEFQARVAAGFELTARKPRPAR